ncbi:MAG: T9SS type A sorting domain-containing protein, partial [Cytophagales bacterium]|nr:T9SS type A sorting domain-containing protein [Cytophagales bacterium]
GFGNATIIDSLRIVWPASGITQIFTNVAVDQFIEITEGINAIAIAEPCVPDLPVEDPGFVTGTVTNDIDSNCFIDPVIDLGLPNRLIQAKKQSTQENFFVFSDSEGDYEFRLPPSVYEVNQVKIQNDILKELDCPDTDSLYVVNAVSGDTIGDNDYINFLVQQVCGVSINIVGIYSSPLASACPGIPHTYCVTFTNNGNPVQNAILSINLDPNLIILSTSGSCCMNPPPVGQTVSCTIPSFPTNASCDICVDVLVPPTFSDPLTTTASIDGECVTPPPVFSNSASFTDNNNCALDPNDKLLVTPKGCGFFNNIGRDDKLIYQIRFQNVGTAPAFNIVIRDELDNALDITTLKLLSTSHLLTRFEIIPENALIFSFENINLPDSASDPEGSNGFVIFSIKPKINIPDGTTINNQAGIYFDLNEVVLTNSTLNTIRDNPFPIADFEAHHSCTSTGLVFDFTYTGGTSDSTAFEWDFGSDAIPTTSTDENPAGILFANTGLKQVTLTITRFGCVSEITKTVDVTTVQCGKNNDKILICHTPPGNPGNSKILCINPSSLSDHLGHGDCIGSCAPSTARFAKNQESEVLQKELVLTVYPNPVNEEVTISFLLPESDIAKLEVYNYMGVRVAILFDQPIKAKLPYNIIFSTENLPAGYYFAVFQTSKERIITKMSILK